MVAATVTERRRGYNVDFDSNRREKVRGDQASNDFLDSTESCDRDQNLYIDFNLQR